MTFASSVGEGSRPITLVNVSLPTTGSVIPASVNLPMSAGIPYSSLNAQRQLLAPAPPVVIKRPSTSKRIACGRSI